jgi:DNA-binding transcriptional LysR family regulator
MTLKELNFFYKLCENPTVSQVANELDISQSAISIAIKSLENKLGETLFDRVGKKLILNERGRYFKDVTYEHFIAIYDNKSLFQKNKLAGKIKIASSKTIGNYIMPNIYFDFMCKYKDVNLDIYSMNSSLIIEKVLEGELDLALIEAPCDNPNIIKQKILDDELLVVTSDKNTPKETYIDSIDKKWILREIGSGTRDTFIKHIGSIADELNIFMHLYEFDEIKKIILENSDTVTAISKVAVKKELENKELFQIKLINISLKREFNLIYHKNKVQSLLFKTLVEFINTQIIKKYS